MFETARVRAAHRNFGSLSLSIFMHAAIVTAILAATLSSTHLPAQPPKELMPIFVAPALPLAEGTSEPVKAKPRSVPAAPHQVAEPATAPQTIPTAAIPVTAAVGPAAGPAGPATESGVPNGVPHGIPVDITNTAPPVAPDAAGPLQVGGKVKAPVVIHRVDPIYPQVALYAHLGGSVIVECIIDKSGHIREAHAVQSSFGAFEQPAIDAVQQWLFAPGTLNGQPVDTIFRLTVRFEIR